MPILDKLIALFQSEPSPEAQASLHLIRQGKYKPSKPYTTNMLNSITLSSDMKTLYLIDNGRAISYSLEAGNGILIGALKEQLVVASALTPIDETPIPDGGDATAGRAANPKLRLNTTGQNQWTFTYNRPNRKLTVIGVGDIEISLRNPNDSKDCDSFDINLGKYIVHIVRKNDNIEITQLDILAT
ncbi:MAG: hypothetical protein HUU01_22520 [Saprospiraceae bacterium]|nr:hypothetical protein [Saprospiraceae bacterium]